jgi:hypothetical protein
MTDRLAAAYMAEMVPQHQQQHQQHQQQYLQQGVAAALAGRASGTSQLARTPKASIWGSGQMLAPFFNPSSVGDSPVFLPVLPVRLLSQPSLSSIVPPQSDDDLPDGRFPDAPQIEPSPTTGIQHMIPPLFHGSAARLANRSEVLNRLGGAQAPPIHPGSGFREMSPPVLSSKVRRGNGAAKKTPVLRKRRTSMHVRARLIATRSHCFWL